MYTNLNLPLKKITTPGQYINSEWNTDKTSIAKKWNNKGTLKICICFPDKYTIGMSNLGIEILYKLLNSYEDILCERVFAPDIDMEIILKKENIPLFSLETHHNLKEFDVIGFSLQHELSYTNIFTILLLSGINFERKNRTNTFPLIIAGGPCSCNPYVLEEYIDVFILGESEDSIIEFTEIIKKHKKNNTLNKKEILKEIDNLQETYVPGITSKKTIVPAVVNIKKSFYPKRPTVPLIRTTHNRLNIELTRGCAYSCNFCQAGYIHKPLRYRDKEYVIDIIEESIKSTGYDEVSLTGFCVTNYPYLKDIIDYIHSNFAHQYVSVSLPSLRIEDITEELIQKLTFIRRSTITLAPEAATERLRNVLNKKISDEEIYKKINMIYNCGYKKIKLYFMIGLPTETEQDITAIPKLIKILKTQNPGLNFNITISIFIPKPHTPFQFSRLDEYDVLYKKLQFLKKHLKKEISIINIENEIYLSYLEALISRGDKMVGKLLQTAWEEGARFDNWNEHLNINLWKDILKKIDFEEYILKQTDIAYNFVWDNIKYAQTKEQLFQKYKKHTENTTQVATFLDISNKPNKNFQNLNITHPTKIQQTNHSLFLKTLRLKFSKTDKAKFISYLDELEIFKRAIRMSELKISYTQGFNPQIKMSTAPAISLGYESNSEYLDIEIYENHTKEEILEKMNRFLPEGFKLLNLKFIDLPLNKIPPLNNTVNLFEYYIKSKYIFSMERLDQFIDSDNYIVEKQKLNKLQTINLKEIIKEIKLLDNNTLYLILRFKPDKNIKVEIILNKIFSFSQEEIYDIDIIRNEIFIEKEEGIIHYLI